MASGGALRWPVRRATVATRRRPKEKDLSQKCRRAVAGRIWDWGRALPSGSGSGYVTTQARCSERRYGPSFLSRPCGLRKLSSRHRRWQQLANHVPPMGPERVGRELRSVLGFFLFPLCDVNHVVLTETKGKKKTTKSIPSLTFLLLSISARLSHLLYFRPHPPSRAFISSSQSKDAGCAELLGRADVRQVAGQPRRAGSPARLLRPPAERSIANHPGSRAGGSTRPRRGSPSSRASRTPT